MRVLQMIEQEVKGHQPNLLLEFPEKAGVAPARLDGLADLSPAPGADDHVGHRPLGLVRLRLHRLPVGIHEVAVDLPPRPGELAVGAAHGLSAQGAMSPGSRSRIIAARRRSIPPTVPRKPRVRAVARTASCSSTRTASPTWTRSLTRSETVNCGSPVARARCDSATPSSSRSRVKISKLTASAPPRTARSTSPHPPPPAAEAPGPAGQPVEPPVGDPALPALRRKVEVLEPPQSHGDVPEPAPQAVGRLFLVGHSKTCSISSSVPFPS